MAPYIMAGELIMARVAGDTAKFHDQVRKAKEVLLSPMQTDIAVNPLRRGLGGGPRQAETLPAHDGTLAQDAAFHRLRPGQPGDNARSAAGPQRRGDLPCRRPRHLHARLVVPDPQGPVPQPRRSRQRLHRRCRRFHPGKTRHRSAQHHGDLPGRNHERHVRGAAPGKGQEPRS